MKKLLTLCLALAMTLSVGAYALTTLCGDLFLDEKGTTPATEDNLKIAKLQKKGCKGSVGGLGLALAAFGAAFVALKKKR